MGNYGMGRILCFKLLGAPQQGLQLWPAISFTNSDHEGEFQWLTHGGGGWWEGITRLLPICYHFRKKGSLNKPTCTNHIPYILTQQPYVEIPPCTELSPSLVTISHNYWLESKISIKKALEAFQRHSIPLHWLQEAGETRTSMIQQSQQNTACICLTLEESVWKPSNALTSSQPIGSAAFHSTLTSACWTTAKQSAKDKTKWIQWANLATTSSPKPLLKGIC